MLYIHKELTASLILSFILQGNPGSDGPPGRDGSAGIKVGIKEDCVYPSTDVLSLSCICITVYVVFRVTEETLDPRVLLVLRVALALPVQSDPPANRETEERP